MRIHWLQETPFGRQGEIIEYPPTTKPFMLRLVAGAVVNKMASIDGNYTSPIMLMAMEEYLHPEFGCRDEVGRFYREMVTLCENLEDYEKPYRCEACPW